jgi:hypothetical protein
VCYQSLLRQKAGSQGRSKWAVLLTLLPIQEEFQSRTGEEPKVLAGYSSNTISVKINKPKKPSNKINRCP